MSCILGFQQANFELADLVNTWLMSCILGFQQANFELADLLKTWLMSFILGFQQANFELADLLNPFMYFTDELNKTINGQNGLMSAEFFSS